MKHNQLWLGSLTLLLSLYHLSLPAQNLSIEGQVLSQDSVPLSFAQIQLLRPPYYLKVVQADSLGRFSFEEQSAGQYQLEMHWKGMRQSFQWNTEYSITSDTLYTHFALDQINWYAVGGRPAYFSTKTNARTNPKQSIQAQATRNISTVATLSPGDYQGGGSGLVIRGSRSISSITYIDGVKVRGRLVLPQPSIQQLSGILSGTPAEIEYNPDGLNHLALPAKPDPTKPILHPYARQHTFYYSRYKPRSSPKQDKEYIIDDPFLIPLIENQVQIVSTAPLSTFSVDVDAASYTLFRRETNLGQTLAANSIRTEEFINYFDYELPKPANEHPIALDTEVSPCPWNSDHQLVRISMQAKELAAQVVPPSNLVFLIDVSGSMSTPMSLPLLQNALVNMVSRLSSKDKLSIVVYAGASGVVLPPTSGNEKFKIKEAIMGLTSNGGTNGAAGIKLAYQLAEKNFIEGANNRVILCTDGDFNVGISDTESLVKLIEVQREKDIFLSVLGVGFYTSTDHMMEEVSNHGNGNYYFLDSPREAERVLGEELLGTLYTVAKDVKLQIEFNPQKVNAYRLLGYENRMLANADFALDSVDAGDIGAGQQVTALYEIVPYRDADKPIASQYQGPESLFYPTAERQNSLELLTVSFRYKLPDANQSQLLSQSLFAGITPWERCSPNHRWAASVAECTMLLRNSSHIKTSSFEQAIGRAISLAGKDEEKLAFIELMRKVQTMQAAYETP